MRLGPHLAALLALGYSGPSSLVVQVRTDLAPVREFALARVRVIDASGVEDVTITAAADHVDWGRGVRVAELGGLAAGRYRVLALLERADASAVIERPARVDVSEGLHVLTILLTRDCAGVVCPGAGEPAEATACLAGHCVEEDCTEERGGCAGECVTAADCAGVAVPACGTLECTPSGSCFASPEHAACADGEVCDARADACVPREGCEAWGPWSAPTPVPGEVNTADNDHGPSLSGDGLTLYFTRTPPSGNSTLMRARRSDRGADFGPAEAVASLAALDAGEPALAASGRTLYFSTRPLSGDGSMFVADVDAAGEVGPPRPLDFTAPGADATTAPDVSADERILAFTYDPYGVDTLYVAERPTTDVAFGTPTRIDTSAAGTAAGWACLSWDGRELDYEAAPPGASGYLDLFVARRATRADPFGPPTPVDELNLAGFTDGDAELTPDGSTIVFASSRDPTLGGFDLWFSTRECR